MGIVIDSAHLRLELARRGLSEKALASEARLSAATISSAVAGRAISASSLCLIAKALNRIPPIPGIDSLLLDGSGDHLRLG